IDDDRARLHALDGLGRHERRRLAARHERGRDDDVELLDRVGQRLLLLRAFLVGQLARVAALAGRLDAEVEPVRAERPDLLGNVSGARKPTRIEPSPSLPISSGVGAATFTTTSALHGSPIFAPASSNSASGISAASPAPDSTTTSTSFACRRLTTSGTIATRR